MDLSKSEIKQICDYFWDENFRHELFDTMAKEISAYIDKHFVDVKDMPLGEEVLPYTNDNSCSIYREIMKR
jgi:hexokinase